MGLYTTSFVSLYYHIFGVIGIFLASMSFPPLTNDLLLRAARGDHLLAWNARINNL